MQVSCRDWITTEAHDRVSKIVAFERAYPGFNFKGAATTCRQSAQQPQDKK
jgi:hypothetical protein